MDSPIKWHGGKHYLAKTIISLMPKEGITTFVEPYFGSGAVLLSMPAGDRAEIVNDVDSGLANFWKVLRDPDLFPAFVHQVSLTPFSQEEFEAASEPQDDPVLAAVSFFVRCRQSRQGLMKDFATMTLRRMRRRMNEQAAAWLSAVEGLDDVHDRLSGVVVFNEDALNLIESCDSSETFFYLDPPYLSATRTAKKAYRHETNDEHHQALLELLSRIEGRFLLSGYPSDLYSQFADGFDWSVREIKIDNKASGAAVKPQMTECLWANYALP